MNARGTTPGFQSIPGHAGRQRDLAISYGWLADVQPAPGDLPGALGSAPAGFGFTIQHRRSVTYDGLAVVYAEPKQMPTARAALLASRAVAAGMGAQHPE